jgi:hypothetical protein
MFTPRRSISSQCSRLNPYLLSWPKHKVSVSLSTTLISYPSHLQRRRSPLLPLSGPPATPSLAAYRRRSVSSSSAHSLAAAASPGPQSRIFAYPSDCRVGRRLGRRPPISRRSARLQLCLDVDLPAVGSAARPRHRRPLLAIPGHRPPASSASATYGTPPAYSRGIPTSGSP